MIRNFAKLTGLLGIAAIVAACSTLPRHEAEADQAPVLPPELVTYSGSDTERIEHGELILDVDQARQALHAQHHPHKAIETRRIPGRFEPPAMTSIEDFALSKQDLVVINPGPGEYVHVMEGSATAIKT